jgi:hypothetical protein
VPPLAARVVKTGTVSIQVPANGLGPALARLSAQVDQLGGFVSGSSEQSATSSSSPSGSLTLRVPVGRFEALVAYATGLGKVQSSSTSGQDVTASYVDLQARITALQGTRSQFEQILARATTIGDILSVENQISDLQTQIEQLQGQFNVLDNQTSYSTLTVNVAEQPKPGVVLHPPKPAGGLAKAWRHARDTFVNGVEGVISASGGIAVFLLFAGLLGWAGWYGWKVARRRWT